MTTDDLSMDRRTLLKGIGGAAAVTGTAGCMGTWTEMDQQGDTLYLEKDVDCGFDCWPEYRAARVKVDGAFYGFGVEEIQEDEAVLWYEDDAEPVGILESRGADDTLRKRERSLQGVTDGDTYEVDDLPAPLDTFTAGIDYFGEDRGVDMGRLTVTFEEDVTHGYIWI